MNSWRGRGGVSLLPASLLSLLLGAVTLQSGCGGADCPNVTPPRVTDAQRALLNAGAEAFQELPPDTFFVELETTTGEIVIEVVRAWAPLGATRFYNLARHGFFDGAAFFRVIPGFVAQFGVHPVPQVQAAWNERTLPDEPVRQSNARGTLTFAAAGDDTRTTQLFINYADNSRLDALGFSPIGRVARGMGVADRLYSEYGEFAPQGQGPDYACMMEGGSAYLERRFPRLDVIRTARLVARDAV